MTAVTIADISVRHIRPDNVWRWISNGWSDTWTRPGISLGYGLFVTGLSYALTACLYYFNQIYLLLPLAAAFMFGGPLLAVGLYEMSRRYAEGRPVRLADALGAFRRAPLQLAYMGLMLVLFALLWIRVATLLFALFFGSSMPPLAEFFSSLFLTIEGVTFLAIGTAIGAALAFAAFSISVVSIPMIVDREVDVMTATIASLVAVRDNFAPMMLWAWLVAMLTAVGIVALFFGLIVIFPLVGHATWYCYRDVLGGGD
jgi:uncharacterized membrane protein